MSVTLPADALYVALHVISSESHYTGNNKTKHVTNRHYVQRIRLSFFWNFLERNESHQVESLTDRRG